MNKELSRTIVDAAVEVHHLLGGSNLLKNIYESALCHELKLRGQSSNRHLEVPVLHKNIPVREPLFLDSLVENQTLTEIKPNVLDGTTTINCWRMF